jgi:hypothetical protein
MTASIHSSNAVMADETDIPDGIVEASVSNHEGNDNITQLAVNVVSGDLTIPVDVHPGVKYRLSLYDTDWPPQNVATLFGRTTGEVECFAYESIRTGEGFTLSTPFTINGSADIDETHILANGSAVSITESGQLHWSANGAFDYLNPGETATQTVDVTYNSDTISGDILSFAATPTATNATYSSGTQTFTVTADLASTKYFMVFDNIVAGDNYYLTINQVFTDAGAVEAAWVDASVNSLGSFGSGPFNGPTETQSSIAPVGAVGIRLTDGNRPIGDTTTIVSMQKDIAAEPETLSWTVKGADNVSAKLVEVDGFSGTGWTHNGGGEYQVTDNTLTTPLTATITTTENKLIQIKIKTKDVVSGTVKPQIQGDTLSESDRDYSVGGNEKDVWLIQAPAGTAVVQIVPTGFEGKVEDLIIKELITEASAADVEDFTVTDLATSGDALLKFDINPVSGRRSDTETPTYLLTGELTQDDDFAFRHAEPASSLVVHDAFAVGTRSGISLSDGGSWVELKNVTITGGFTNHGIRSAELIDSSTYSGTNWTNNGYNSYTHTTGSTVALEATIAATEADTLYIAIAQKNAAGDSIDPADVTGSITVELVGDTTTTATAQTSDQVFTEYLCVVPANVTTVRITPTSDYDGMLYWIVVAKMETLTTEGGDDKFQSCFATANRRGPQVDFLQATGCRFDLMLRPMLDNYETTNTDGWVLNRENDDYKNTYSIVNYFLNCQVKNVSDGCLDGKPYVEQNHIEFDGGHRCERLHSEAHHLTANSMYIEQYGGQAAISYTDINERAGLWNCYYDSYNTSAVRITSGDQLLSIVKTDGQAAIGTDVSDESAAAQTDVLTTYPKLNGYCKVAMTSMDFNYKLSSSGTWLELALPLSGLPGWVGIFERTINLSAGTYDFRARCLNGEHVGSWNTITNQGIS